WLPELLTLIHWRQLHVIEHVPFVRFQKHNIPIEPCYTSAMWADVLNNALQASKKCDTLRQNFDAFPNIISCYNDGSIGQFSYSSDIDVECLLVGNQECFLLITRGNAHIQGPQF